jgi:hypothetical protein
MENNTGFNQSQNQNDGQNNEQSHFQNKHEQPNTPYFKMPWQFSTAGIILGFFFGFHLTLIALVGNHQYKQNKNTNELKSAYNIIFILSIVLIAIITLFVIIAIAAGIINESSYYSYY